MGALIGAISGAVAGYLDPVTSNGVSYNATSSAGGRSLTVEMFAPSRTPFPVSTGGGITLTPSEASAAGGAVTAAGTAAMNGGIGAPSTLVSMIPVIGSAWESAHYFSTGHWVMGTALAGMAVLDLTGVGEAGGMMLKMGLKVAEKTTAKIAAERSGAYLLKFESGRMYIGKGLESRMWQSASRIESAGDKVVSATHFPAANGREAFIKEYQLMKETGQRPLHWDPNSKLYNKIWSPGKRLSGE
jgi:hypothetical protein